VCKMLIYKYKRLFGCVISIYLSACSISDPLVQGPGLGKLMKSNEIQAIDISIGPDGVGLPIASGNAKLGASVYAAKCQSCHGLEGQGKPADALVGGVNSLASNKPIRTVGSFWPYATTLFDYTRRAMPLQNPKSLTNQEVYAVSAYILFLNGIITEDFELNEKNLAQVKMPNRDGFIDFSRSRSVQYK
jgi:hypothetical protein